MEIKRTLSLLAVFLLLCQPLSVFGVSLGDAPSPDVQEAGIISETKYYVQGEYPVCSDGKISEPCKCGEKAYNAGFCCRGIWFDPYYESIFSNNTCPAGNFYFVDQNHPNASDDNPGTEELPWKTITHAVQAVQAGDIVYVRAGTYYIKARGDRFEPALNPANSGSPGKYIVIAGYNGEPVTITYDPQISGPDGPHSSPLIGAYRKSYIKWEGFKILCICGLKPAEFLLYKAG